MKVLMISTDRKVFDKGSSVRTRMVEYGKLAEELHIIVFAKKYLGFKNTVLGGNVYLYPTSSFSKWTYISGAIKIGRNICSKKNVDLITTQDPFEAGFAGLRIAKGFDINIQAQVHTDFLNPYFKTQSWLNRIRVRISKYVLKRVDCVRVVSNKIKENLEREIPYTKGKISVLPIYTNVGGIINNSDTVGVKKRYKQFEKIVLMVSRLEKEKNVELGIRAFVTVLKKYPKAGLIIAGDGSELRNLKKLSKELKADKNIIFVGFVDDVLKYYREVDLYLHTSNFEGYGMSLVEAAASDCPIVSTEVGIARDIISNQNAQLLCGVGDEKCLSEALLGLLKNDDLRNKVILTQQASLSRICYDGEEKYLEELKNTWNNCVRLNQKKK